MLNIVKNQVKRVAFWFIKKYWVAKFKQYQRIVVSGCQRSGTTIVSQMIASDLGYRNIDEYEFGTHNYDDFREFLNLDNIVIQCPAITHKLHDIDVKNTLIIWMERPIDEVRRSMERINWDVEWEDCEKLKYKGLDGIETNQPIEVIKKNYWDNVQKKRLHCQYLEFKYHSLYVTLHPRYISKRYRKELVSKQTKL